jgi:ornithine cyclodeaminase/alanine dehydrogenase-like protein (mu-crystallin family)
MEAAHEMRILNAAQIRALVRMPRLIEALRDAFRGALSVPERQVIHAPGGTGDRLILELAEANLR